MPDAADFIHAAAILGPDSTRCNPEKWLAQNQLPFTKRA
jgi:hypothetical protein